MEREPVSRKTEVGKPEYMKQLVRGEAGSKWGA